MLIGALVVMVVLLTWPVPRLLPRWHALEKVPGPGLVLWQSVSLSAIVAALLIAPLTVLIFVRRGNTVPHPSANLPLLILGLALSALVLARLLLQGHRIGLALRQARREHMAMVDVLGADESISGDSSVTVLEHPTPTAYCIPGRRQRVVLTDGTLQALPADELAAVLSHERDHLHHRHDLILEFFTVLHTVAPQAARSDAGMRQVKLLIELLADRAAVRSVGPVPLARALVDLSQSPHPPATLGAGGDPDPTGRPAVRRLELLGDPRPHRGLGAAVLLLAAGVLVAPFLVAGAVLLGGGS